MTNLTSETNLRFESMQNDLKTEIAKGTFASVIGNYFDDLEVFISKISSHEDCNDMNMNAEENSVCINDLIAFSIAENSSNSLASFDISAFLKNSIIDNSLDENAYSNANNCDLNAEKDTREAIENSNDCTVSYIEEIRMLKKLYDEGILSQEEFDKKKAQLLNV